MTYSQADWQKMQADPNGVRQFLIDWANGGAATHQVAGAGDVGLSAYEQALADFASRGGDIGGVAAHASAPAATQGPGLSPSYEANYQDQLRQLGLTRDEGMAQNEYARGLAKQRGDRAMTDLGQQWGQRRTQLPGSFIQRGVFGTGASTSGIYQDALSQFTTQRATDTQNLQDQQNEQMRQYDVNAANIGNTYNQNQLGLKTKRESDIQTTAAALQGARPFTA